MPALPALSLSKGACRREPVEGPRVPISGLFMRKEPSPQRVTNRAALAQIVKRPQILVEKTLFRPLGPTNRNRFTAQRTSLRAPTPLLRCRTHPY